MAAGFFMLELGKWRYFITGALLLLLFGLCCRAIGRVLAPFGVWRVFSGTLTESDGRRVCAVFTDAHRLQHTAAFLLPEETVLPPETPLKFAIRAEVFSAGTYPQTLAAADSSQDILPYSAYRAWCRRTVLGILLRELIFCGIALAAFLVSMRICFPAH